MNVVLCAKYPELLVIEPRVEFEDGRAEVTDADVAELKKIAHIFGFEFTGDAPVVGEPTEPEPEPAEPESPEPVAPTPVELPGSRASVKDWVEFMAANGIEHPEEATKAEMHDIAVKHFEQ